MPFFSAFLASEHGLCKPGVVGSSPIVSTRSKSCRILDLDTCRRSAVRPETEGKRLHL